MTNENNPDQTLIQAKDSTTSIPLRPVRSMTCYICLEDIVSTQKKFGLQSNCDHFFCYDCLLTWRRTGTMIDKDTGARCPLCRTRSTFIAPSDRCFDHADDKQLLIDAHKTYLKSVPCRRLFRFGYCQFGHRCYYNHNHRLTTRRWPSFNTIQTNLPVTSEINETDTDEQQQPPRRITFNAYRYRPY